MAVNLTKEENGRVAISRQKPRHAAITWKSALAVLIGLAIAFAVLYIGRQAYLGDNSRQLEATDYKASDPQAPARPTLE